MELHISAPIFLGKDKPREIRRRRAAFNEWQVEAVPALRKEYDFSRISCNTPEPGRILRLRVNKDYSIEVNYPAATDAAVPKGVLVRLELLAILDWIDLSADPIARKDSYFILVDGSGAFDYSSVYKVMAKLWGPPRHSVVFGCRPKDNTGMPPWRREIELFEEHLLLEKYGDRIKALSGLDHLPDSQAGCWGFRLGALSRLPLSARSYAIEFDLLASVLQGQVSFAYTDPLPMGVRRESSFSKSEIDEGAIINSIEKLRFIIHKLDLSVDDLPKFLESYLRSGGTLCDQYRRAVHRMAMPHTQSVTTPDSAQRQVSRRGHGRPRSS